MSRPGRPISLSTKLPTPTSESEVMEAWALEASALVKRVMLERGWGYSDLADALRAQGIRRSAALINRRINRGSFSAGFLFACLRAMGYAIEVRGPES